MSRQSTPKDEVHTKLNEFREWSQDTKKRGMKEN